MNLYFLSLLQPTIPRAKNIKVTYVVNDNTFFDEHGQPKRRNGTILDCYLQTRFPFLAYGDKVLVDGKTLFWNRGSACYPKEVEIDFDPRRINWSKARLESSFENYCHISGFRMKKRKHDLFIFWMNYQSPIDVEFFKRKMNNDPKLYVNTIMYVQQETWKTKYPMISVLMY
jgi:hypothetical protein